MSKPIKPTRKPRTWSESTSIKRAKGEVEELERQLKQAKAHEEALVRKKAARDRLRLLEDKCLPRLEAGETIPELQALADAVLVRANDRELFGFPPLAVDVPAQPPELSTAASNAASVETSTPPSMDSVTEPVAESSAELATEHDVDPSMEAVDSANENFAAEDDEIDECPPTGTDAV